MPTILPVHVRRATPADAPDIIRLGLDVQATHVAGRPDLFRPGGVEPVGVIAHRLTDPGHCYWVAIVDGAAVGYAYGRFVDEPESLWRYAARVFLLDQMSVEPRHRSRGVGSALWRAVREMALGEGADRVILNVWAFNTAARRFYARLGFAPFHERLTTWRVCAVR